MLFQGPVAFNWADGCVDDGALEDTSPASPRRLPGWLSAHVHVRGRPEWVFVKLYTHAMQSRRSFLGPGTDATFRAMEQAWGRPPFRLHYVTAREAYNIARAAEAGHSGDPNDYRDFAVPPPANRVACCDVPWRLLSRSPERVHLRVLGAGPARLELAGPPSCVLTGPLREVEAIFRRSGELVALNIDAAPWAVQVSPPCYRGLVRGWLPNPPAAALA
jgi:hypothetical protein